jgi:hypothetical protein
MTKGEKITLFVSSEIAERVNEIKPWGEKTDKIDTRCKLGCQNGYMTAEDFCSCTEVVLLKQILNIPPRFDVEFTSPAYQAMKTNLLQNKFILLKGADLYAKLVAYDLGKQIVMDGKIVVYVKTQMTMPAYDQLAMTHADVVIFNDLAGRISDINYKIELDGRMDRNKPVIFINTPTLVSISDNEDGCVYDVFLCEVDTLCINVVSK